MQCILKKILEPAQIIVVGLKLGLKAVQSALKFTLASRSLTVGPVPSFQGKTDEVGACVKCLFYGLYQNGSSEANNDRVVVIRVNSSYTNWLYIGTELNCALQLEYKELMLNKKSI